MVRQLLERAAEAFCSLGNAYKAKGDLDQAEEAYRQSCSLDPRQAVAHNNLGNVMRLKGDHAAALNSYNRAVAADPGYSEAHYNRSVSLLEVGRARMGGYPWCCLG